MSDQSKSVIEIDHAELTIRLLEIGIGLKRPDSQSAWKTLNQVRSKAAAGNIPAYIVNDFEAMAVAAVKYMQECADKRHRVQ